MALFRKIGKLVDRLLELFFPPRCPFCDVVLQRGGICAPCQKRLHYVTEPMCYKCGKSLTDAEKEWCRDCQKVKHLYDQGFALYQYESVKSSLYRFKYHDRPAYASIYAKDMVNHFTFLQELSIDCIVPVPMAKAKQRVRGYNQAEELARYLSEGFGIPMRSDILRRTKKTKPMKELGPKERQLNLRNAFQICANDVKLEVVLLVDDIYTTGATMDACAEVLKAAGARKVYYVSLAIGKGV